MAKYKNCPVCHTINLPEATICSECGYHFRDEPALTDAERKRIHRKKKLTSAIMSCAIFIVLISLIIATMMKGPSFGGLVILIWLGVLVIAVLALYIVSKIIKYRDIKKHKNKQD